MLMIWDGFGFFSFNEKKIDRTEIKLTNKFGSGWRVCINFMVLIVSLYIIWLYAITYGQLKLQGTRNELVVDSIKANST